MKQHVNRVGAKAQSQGSYDLSSATRPSLPLTDALEFSPRLCERALQGGAPGLRCQSDHGRIDILYGPPDEIQVHPIGSPQILFPFELRPYRNLPDIGKGLTITFIDRNMMGECRIAPGSES